MHFALVEPEHSAYGPGMQAAYARRMSESSPRQQRRREKLIQLLAEIGGPTQAETDTGTPRSHFSAISAGRRGVGDALAHKLERCYGKPPGWFDQPLAYWPFSDDLWESVKLLNPDEVARAENLIRAHLNLQPLATTLALAQAQPSTTVPKTGTMHTPVETNSPPPVREGLFDVQVGEQSSVSPTSQPRTVPKQRRGRDS